MRRNLTISFDAAWIELLDQRRGKRSRGEFLECLALESGGWGFGPSYSNPEKGAPGVQEAERSPDLSHVMPPEFKERLAEGPVIDKIMAKPPLQRPIVQKRGK